MMHGGVRVGIGTRFAYDGEVIEVVAVHSVGGTVELLAKDSRTESIRRFAIEELISSDRSRILSEDLVAAGADGASGGAAVEWSAVPESARHQARERSAHIREVLTGYRSGCPETALPHEPRASYSPVLPKQARMAAKAKEFRVGFRTVERWVSKYESDGEVGLLPARDAQLVPITKKFELFAQVALDVMREHTDMSRPTRGYVRAHSEARLTAMYGVGAVEFPSQATAYRIFAELERQYPLFTLSTKRNRDVAARPVTAYGKMHPVRPGEYVLMDTTYLDVYAMDQHTLRWVGVDLTVAMDWYSRCIIGLRLTPMSTKAIDAASVLYQAFRPMPAGRDWPAEAVWPTHGVPRSVLVENDALDPHSVFAASPAICSRDRGGRSRQDLRRRTANQCMSADGHLNSARPPARWPRQRASRKILPLRSGRLSPGVPGISPRC
ncbi:MAG: hypothetical protein QOG95_1683 [Mycobacterium sp.]|jgi:hypothetical protein|nr:hypothetical protein [Mycobacterium sp.]